MDRGENGNGGAEMKDHTRRAIAYIVGRLAGPDGSSVYDYSVSKHFNFSGNVSQESVSVYCYDQKCHIGGSVGNLYHHGNKKHIGLNYREGTFDGYDYDSSKHYSGTVSGNSVSIYDHEHSKHFNYGV